MVEPKNDVSGEFDPDNLLEERQPLSQSILWDLQQNFYQQGGTQAWTQNKIPQYPTTNPVIALAYAKVVFGWIRDCFGHEDEPGAVNSMQLDLREPLYIIEIGSGSGKFAYHFMTQFFRLLEQSPFHNVPVKYVMTDIVEQTVHYWHMHPSLKTYIEEGRLDFAVFDAVANQELRLVHSNTVLSTLVNPLVIIANYVFDSIPQDIFRIRGDRLFQSLVSIHAPISNETEGLWEEAQIIYHDEPVEIEYYSDPQINQVLASYRARLDGATLLFPSGPLQCLQTCRRISRDRLLVLAADKGFLNEEDLAYRDYPSLVKHSGGFSFMVNFHALREYIRLVGGHTLTTPGFNNTLHIVAFLVGDHTFLETRQAYQEAIEHHNPYAFYTLQTNIWSRYETLTTEQQMAFLKLSHWDTEIFFDLFPFFMQHLDELLLHKQAVYHMIEQVWRMYFYVSEEEDLPFCLGKLLCGLTDYEKAIYYLEQSIKLYAPRIDNLFHLVLCHNVLKNYEMSLKLIQQIQEIDAEYLPAKLLKAQVESQKNQS